MNDNKGSVFWPERPFSWDASAEADLGEGTADRCTIEESLFETWELGLVKKSSFTSFYEIRGDVWIKSSRCARHIFDRMPEVLDKQMLTNKHQL